VALHLQINEPHRMPGAPGGVRDKLKPQRLKPEKDVGVEQRAWMNAKKLHWNLSKHAIEII
jgi:hypothetical protein